MKKIINSSWYKVTIDEIKNKKYLKRNISELIKEAGYKEREKEKLTFLPSITTIGKNEKKNETPKKYNNYLNTKYKKRAKSHKILSNKKENITNKKSEKINDKNMSTKISKKNINKEEFKKQDELCFYCLSYLEEPIILECSHKICKKCLDEMILFNEFIKENDEKVENKGKKSPMEIFGITNW